MSTLTTRIGSRKFVVIDAPDGGNVMGFFTAANALEKRFDKPEQFRGAVVRPTLTGVLIAAVNRHDEWITSQLLAERKVEPIDLIDGPNNFGPLYFP